MYAIVSTGGKQVKVSPGDVVRIEKVAHEQVAKGDVITFNEVAFVADGDSFRSGVPHLSGVSVRATVLASLSCWSARLFLRPNTCEAASCRFSCETRRKVV